MMQRNRLFITIATLVLALCLALGNTIAAAQQPVFDSRIVIHVPSRTLLLYYGDVVVKTYPVGVGRADFPTPEGQFRVINKVEDPGWENPFKHSSRKNRVKPGSSSPLGTRWIGFLEANGGEYGIHGTNAPHSVGKFSSHGCVRMYIRDAEALFNQVAVGTPV
jgi:L,D-transpeptidase ErfK/SrfK